MSFSANSVLHVDHAVRMLLVKTGENRFLELHERFWRIHETREPKFQHAYAFVVVYHAPHIMTKG